LLLLEVVVVVAQVKLVAIPTLSLLLLCRAEAAQYARFAINPHMLVMVEAKVD
jgi:hypothetical protein